MKRSKLHQLIEGEFGRTLTDKFQFTQTYWLFCIAAVTLVFSITFNLNAIIPRDTARFTVEYYERLVVLFHIALLLIGIGLLSWQLLIPLQDKMLGLSLVRRKPKIFGSHVLVMAWVLTVISVLFQIWKIIFQIIFFNCDGAIYIPMKELDDHRTLMFIADFLYLAVFSVYLVLQCLYVHAWSKYKIAASRRKLTLPLTTVAIIVINLALYVRMTLIEATHTIQHVQKYLPDYSPLAHEDEVNEFASEQLDFAFDHRINDSSPGIDISHPTSAVTHAPQQSLKSKTTPAYIGDWNCTAYDLSDEMKTYKERVNSNVVEPFGFALTIECLLTLALFVHEIQAHLHEEETHGEHQSKHHDENEEQSGATAHGEHAAVVGNGFNSQSFVSRRHRKRSVVFQGQLVHVEAHNSAQSDDGGAAAELYLMPLQLPAKLKLQAIANVVIGIFIAVLTVLFTIFFFSYIYFYWRWDRASDGVVGGRLFASAGREFVKFAYMVKMFLATEMAASVCLGVVCYMTVRHQQPKRPIPEHSLTDISLLMYSMTGEIALAFFIMLACIMEKSSRDGVRNIIGDNHFGYIAIVFVVKSVVDVFAMLIQALFISRSLGFRTYTDKSKWLFEATSLAAVTFFNLFMWLVEVYARKFTFRANFVAAGQFYNNSVWALINEVCYPIAIFFRFHCFVLSLSIFGMLVRDIRRQKERRLNASLVNALDRTGGEVNRGMEPPEPSSVDFEDNEEAFAQISIGPRRSLPIQRFVGIGDVYGAEGMRDSAELRNVQVAQQYLYKPTPMAAGQRSSFANGHIL